MGLMDFFTPEAGQQRRKWLESQLGGMWEYVPPELRPFVALGNEMNPVTSIERAGQDARRVVAPNVSGWDRMAAAGDMASNMAGVVAPAVAASKGAVPAVQAAEDALMGWSASSPMAYAARDFVTDEFGGVGFRAYHGSPHDFDRFSLDKIGTGEGAQAYGHGLYFADSEGTARFYRDELSGNTSAVTKSGVPLRESKKFGEWGSWVNSKFRSGATPEEIADGLRGMVARDGQSRFAADQSRYRRAMALADEIAAGNVRWKSDGRMYEVQINADPNDFLDWDKPLSEQPAAVRPMLEKWAGALGLDPQTAPFNRVGGLTKSPEGAQTLRDAGIPGIRYLDAGSRGAGDGSRNYVVFDDKLIEILRKYGLVPGMIGAGAYGMQPTEAQAGQ